MWRGLLASAAVTMAVSTIFFTAVLAVAPVSVSLFGAAASRVLLTAALVALRFVTGAVLAAHCCRRGVALRTALLMIVGGGVGAASLLAALPLVLGAPLGPSAGAVLGAALLAVGGLSAGTLVGYGRGSRTAATGDVAGRVGAQQPNDAHGGLGPQIEPEAYVPTSAPH